MRNVQQYVITIIVAGIVVSVVNTLSENRGVIGRSIRMICGLLLISSIFSPIGSLDFSHLFQSFSDIKYEAEKYVIDGQNDATIATQNIIKHNVVTYICDKAMLLGLDPEVEVTMGEVDPYVPDVVRISVIASPNAKQQLQQCIAKDLGIPKENLIWN